MKREFAVSLEALPHMLAFVRRCVCTTGLPPMEIAKVELVAEEILVNVIHHSGLKESDPLAISCTVTGEIPSIQLEIIDSGIAYDPLSHPLPDPQKAIPLEERRPGGYGIFLIRKLMDGVTYHRDNGYNIVTLTKYL
jgi:sigma-B regulation protein RsbU (phosphoserine phosphatase)